MSSVETKPYELFLRKDSSNWWMRFSVPGHGQRRIGLKTTDEAQARLLAEREYHRTVWAAEEGILEGKTSFDTLAQQYLDRLSLLSADNVRYLNQYKHDKGVIDRYLVPFFGRRTVTAIDHPKMDEYLDWRRHYWTTGPGKSQHVVVYERGGQKYSRPAQHIEPALSTLRREAVTIRNVFKLASRLGHIKPGDIPKPELAAGSKNKRPSFTPSEIRLLTQLAEQRMAEIERNMDRTPNAKPQTTVKYERMVLLCFIGIAVATGMRPTELHNLSWSNIVEFAAERKKSLATRRIRILAYGKGRKPQELVPNVEAFQHFDNLWAAFITMHGRAPKPEEAVFANADGERAKSFKKSLNALLEAAKLKTDAFGRPRSAYSFRHTYASNQIRKGTDIYTLAINMRTSVRMIEMYYSDVVPDDMAKKLEGNYD